MVSTQSLANCSNSNSEVTDDNVSVSGSSTSSEEENDLKLAIPNKSNTEDTSFSNVAVSNSNDIRFGNETFYHGPVTIKQFLYENPDIPNDDLNNGNEENINTKLALEDNFVPLHQIPTSKNSNGRPGFTPDPNVIQDNKIVNNSAQHTEVKQDTWSIKNFLKNHIKLLVAAAVVILILIISITCAIVFTYKGESLTIITRVGWIAQPVAGLVPLTLPVGYVIISETQTENCEDQGRCVLIVRLRQSYDIDSNNRTDISYNFLIGGDGAVYEGRGWNLEGAHTYGYNSRSIGIAIIGTFRNQAPFPNQIRVAKKLIEEGLKLGYIVSNYKLFANRQLEVTQNPGEVLYDEIKTWPHWQKS